MLLGAQRREERGSKVGGAVPRALVYLLLEQPRRHGGSEASLTSVPFLTAPFVNDFPNYYVWTVMSYPRQLPLMLKPPQRCHPARGAILARRP